MNHRQIVQIALQCLEALDQETTAGITVRDLSQRQGLPLPSCTLLIRRLSQAGIVDLDETGLIHLSRPIEELTALEILQALWKPENKLPAFRLLVGQPQRGVLRKTLEFVHRPSQQDVGGYLNG